MSNSNITIRSLRRLEETRSPQTKPHDLVIGTAELRRHASDLYGQVTDLDEKALGHELDERASELAQEEPSDLLSGIREEYGFRWEDLAVLIGVSSAALRKWRRGQAITPQNRYQLARVIAFCECLQKRDPRIVDPAQWLMQPLTSNSTLRAADLYAARFENKLLAIARGDMKRSELLETFDPNWHTKLINTSQWKVTIGPDGLPMIVEKE
jgi:DNA-binding transcriptional regulator YiaG